MIEIPEDLIVAVRAAHTEPDIPNQGFSALRGHLLHGGSRPEDDEIEDWLRAQRSAQARAVEVLGRLPAATPGSIPAHHLEWWYQNLLYPWAEDLVVAVTYAFALVDA